MAYRQWREQFIADTAKLGLSMPTISKVLRYAQTYDRLQVAQCNGDWPCPGPDNQNKGMSCPECEGWFLKSTYKSTGCPECRTEKLIKGLMGTDGITGFDFAGDPRGCTLKVKIDEFTIGVPTRGN